MSKIPTKNRELAKARFRELCARCGLPGTDVHHRQRRRDGGHDVWNLVWLCRACHSWAHANPDAAKVTGFIISPWDDLPEQLPVWSYVGPVIFDNEGDYEHCEF